MKGIADHHFRIKELEGLSFEWRLISVTAWECLSNLPIITNSMGTAILRTVEKHQASNWVSKVTGYFSRR
jgi:hypothetical protein